jgi:hypothetical protein
MNMRGMGCALSIHKKECHKSLGCELSTRKYGKYSYNLSHVKKTMKEIHLMLSCILFISVWWGFPLHKNLWEDNKLHNNLFVTDYCKLIYNVVSLCTHLSLNSMVFVAPKAV